MEEEIFTIRFSKTKRYNGSVGDLVELKECLSEDLRENNLNPHKGRIERLISILEDSIRGEPIPSIKERLRKEGTSEGVICGYMSSIYYSLINLKGKERLSI